VAASLLRLRNVPLTGGMRRSGSMCRRLVTALTVSLGETPSKAFRTSQGGQRRSADHPT